MPQNSTRLAMKMLVISFEDAFALKGLPMLEANLKACEISGLLARNIDAGVYSQFPELPIFEKKITQEYLIQLNADHPIDLELVTYLAPYEEQIFYHINRYFDTSLAFDYSLIKYKLILYVLEILKKTSPDILYFGVTPHDPVSYILYLVAMHRNLEVVIITENYVFNCYVLYQEVGKQISFANNGVEEESATKILQKQEHVQECLDTLMQDEPSYMAEQRMTAGNFIRKIRSSLFVKKRVTFSGWLRYKTFNQMKRAYNALATVHRVLDLEHIDAKIIFFSLHFQPELTTSPEGGYFAQQWLAIKKIADIFKEGYIILIKEHPSQFMINAKPVRSPVFYDALLSIAPNIKLAGLNLSSRAILKNAAGVATITGTIGFEALLNQKPVLYFGDARFAGISGAYDYNADQGINDFEKVIATNEPISKQAVISDFKALAKSKFYYCYDPQIAHEERTLEAIKVLLQAYLTWREI